MLEIKKTEVELIRVKAARMELEFKIMDMEEQCKRLQEHIKIQHEKEKELELKLTELKKG